MTSWKNVVPTQARQHELKREILLREAAAAFNRHGFHGTSMLEIANNLGVTKAALYHYFPNKHRLLTACFERAMDAAFRSLERAKAEGRNGREKACLALRLYLEEMIDELSCCVVLTEENAILPEDRDAIVQERDRYEHMMRDLIREGIEDGSIVPCDPKLTVFAMLGAVNWVPKWFSHAGPWNSRQLAGALAEWLERALTTEPAGALVPEVARFKPEPKVPAE